MVLSVQKPIISQTNPSLNECLWVFTNTYLERDLFVKTQDGAQNDGHVYCNIPFSKIFNFT